MNQQSGEKTEIFYNKGNYQNYPQKYTIKIDKTIKHLEQEHLYITTIDNSNPKLDMTRNPAIKMVHNYKVTFVEVFVIWLSNAQKIVILTTHKRLYCIVL